MLALAEGYRQEPVLILQLIRLTVVTLAVETIDACVTADTPVADLRAWLEVLPKPESLQGAMDLGFRGELASGAQFAGKPIGDSLLAVDPAQKKSAAEGSAVLAPYWRNTGARYLRSMLRLVETSRKPYLEARPEITAFIQNLQGKRSVFDLLSALLIPAISKGLDCQVKAQASLAVAQAGLTAELERASTGRYPLKIETVDPLSGKSLLYQREEGTISSAGLPESAPGSIGDEKAAWKLRQSAAPDKK
ncbi:MAG: hypothetical protein HY293_12595 [Planctomycetes bacterium]|nr:hypothetical protein [Planctomycetota bacterium]